MNGLDADAERVGNGVMWRLLTIAALACVWVSLAAAPVSASGSQARVNLRVVDPEGRQLVEAVVHTSSTKVRTSREALCFGEGTGGSGGFAPTAVRGPNAMGALHDAAAELAAVRPLRISDYYSFGQTLCGIGGVEASGSLYWAVWIGPRFVEESADNAGVRTGQSLVFELTEEYPSTRIPDRVPLVGSMPVVGAPGRHPVFGTGLADRVLVRDGARDQVRCRGGEDVVFADATDRISPDCETVRRG